MESLFITFTRAMEGSASLAIAAAFAWGILSVVLSPCHLSSIPLIIGFISEQGNQSSRRAFFLSLLFGLGILITIAAIGVITAATGRMVGDIGSISKYAVAVVLIVIGLHLAGVITLPFAGPGSVGVKSKGLKAAFILGLVFGIALGPCTFAYMAPVLTLSFNVASDKPVYAASLLAAYGIGHSLVIVIAGTSAEAVQNYLNWNEKSRAVGIVKKICGVLVILGGVYFIYTAL